ncbi:acetyltransferase [Pseudoduganella namucuonensis]|uniref:Acetyltransferase n=1 Tax=Pseudoduganella namucuonensis TaxID=1035707 RepID=A0A1I7M5S9_9BURK|nr:acetyltransferase [Pseudoduganella namucuonensis]SFV17293.1 hypothetical protein SAMN05216552_106213 [Pseudoduganella namucuonensis]
MTHFYAFNGDADGLCALQQLRLADAGALAETRLITGVKRDIALLARVPAGEGDQVTVLDISLDQNREALDGLLARGAGVRYFDHHFSGALPESPHFTSYIDEAPDVCTAILVDRHLGGRHRKWAIAAAYGDSLPKVGAAMAAEAGLDQQATATLRDLGTYLNYNAYGESIADLHIDPHALAGLILPYEDPLAFARDSGAYATLSDGYNADMARARQLKPALQEAGATVMLLPDAAWAKRASGVFANELARSLPGSALAMLSPNAAGGFVVSLRVPADGKVAADAFCRRYPTGGGRKLAAGINHLPADELDRFTAAFADCYRSS